MAAGVPGVGIVQSGAEQVHLDMVTRIGRGMEKSNCRVKIMDLSTTLYFNFFKKKPDSHYRSFRDSQDTAYFPTSYEHKLHTWYDHMGSREHLFD